MAFPLRRVTDGDWQTLRLALDVIAQRLNPPLPQARVFNSANLGIASATVTALTFNSEHYDNGDLHSTSVNTGRLTAPITGLYEIGAAIVFDAQVTGVRLAHIRLNGTTVLTEDTRMAVTTAGIGTGINLKTEYQLAAGDYVELRVRQDSGGGLNVLAIGNYSPEFWMSRRGGYTNEGVG